MPKKKNHSNMFEQDIEEDEENWEEVYGIKIQKRERKQEKKPRKEDVEKEE